MVITLSILFIAGLGLVTGGVYTTWKTWQFLQRSVIAAGMVMRLAGSGSTTRAPVVQFRTPEGEIIVFTHPVASNPPSFRTGQVVNVRYQPSRPHEARINSFWSLWLASLLLFFFGLLITVVVGAILMNVLNL
jgi:hypothetical protein